MKTKKFNKKLALNKSTIANLRSQEMTAAKGGEVSDNTCDSCFPPTYCMGCPTGICQESKFKPCG